MKRELHQDDLRDAAVALCKRLERDYQSSVTPYGKGLDAWASNTIIGFEVRLGHARSGPVWGDHARYARRTGLLGLFGRTVAIRSLDEIESEFRLEIEAWLREQETKTKT